MDELMIAALALLGFYLLSGQQPAQPMTATNGQDQTAQPQTTGPAPQPVAPAPQPVAPAPQPAIQQPIPQPTIQAAPVVQPPVVQPIVSYSPSYAPTAAESFERRQQMIRQYNVW
jgi:hypothetical protein